VYRRLLTLILACALGILALAGTASAEISTETVQLDTHAGAPGGGILPVTTADRLTPGASYLVTAGGSFSYYQAKVWAPLRNWVICGNPDATPTNPSARTALTPAGADVETVFGAPIKGGCGNWSGHGPWNAFQVDTGNGFGHPLAVDGAHSTPRVDHTYRYVIGGTGNLASFRLIDNEVRDNSGVVTISLLRCARTGCPDELQQPVQSVAPSTLRNCVSRRAFSVHVWRPKGSRLVRAIVTQNNKRLRTLKVKLGKATVNLRGLPNGRFTVRITLRYHGRTLTQRRQYRTCTTKGGAKTG
jgi:hypothetical protein